MAPLSPARSHAGAAAGHAVEWSVAPGPVLYPDAVEAMEERVAAILARKAPEQVWLLEHPPLYTAGTSARADDLLDSSGLPVYRSGRGGQYTYHGPGQRVAYVMLDLGARGRMDLRCFVRDLEQWLIDTLAEFGVVGLRREGRVGIWGRGRRRRGQDRGDRGARPPLGHLPRCLAQTSPPTSPTTGALSPAAFASTESLRSRPSGSMPRWTRSIARCSAASRRCSAANPLFSPRSGALCTAHTTLPACATLCAARTTIQACATLFEARGTFRPARPRTMVRCRVRRLCVRIAP